MLPTSPLLDSPESVIEAFINDVEIRISGDDVEVISIAAGCHFVRCREVSYKEVEENGTNPAALSDVHEDMTATNASRCCEAEG